MDAIFCTRLLSSRIDAREDDALIDFMADEISEPS
jgi:hypothetical protein